MIELTEVCRFKMKPCARCGKAKTNRLHRKKNVEEGEPFCAFKKQLKCERCGKPKSHIDHFGAPPSYNVIGLGNPKIYLGLKTNWERVLVQVLSESGLPRGLSHVMVEADVSYGNRHDRDEDNAIALVRKFLGDALQAGGWLEKDSWGKIDFTRLERREEPGVSRLRLVLFPSIA